MNAVHVHAVTYVLMSRYRLILKTFKIVNSLYSPYFLVVSYYYGNFSTLSSIKEKLMYIFFNCIKHIIEQNIIIIAI